MTFMEQIEALERLHSLIRRKATGTPEELAERFNVSVGTIKNLLRILKDKELPISYCRNKQTYYYDYDVDVRLFVIDTKENLKKIQGGESFFTFFNPRQNFCLDTSDLCTKLINTDEQNDAGGFRFSGLGY
jgi:DeoR/GlpR family transcriptional regulator of sugar metabolism